MSFLHTLAGRLFKLVFGWYLVLAVVVTSVQLLLEYATVRQHIASDMESLGRSFTPGLADALWAFDRPQLDTMAAGIARTAFITGVRVDTSRGETLARSGAIHASEASPREGLLAPYQYKRFALEIRTPRGELKSIGELQLFSDRNVALERIKYSFMVILINSLIKTAGLWLIFHLVITRSLTRPLAALTDTVSRIEFAADAAAPVGLDYPHRDELGRLLSAMHKMHERLASERQLVEARTRELAQALDAAEQSNRMKSVFLSNMNHELHTPLNAILGFAQIMLRDSRIPEDQHENLRVIDQGGHHLLALINDVLEISRIEAGRLMLQPVDFDLPALLDTLREQVQSRARDKGLDLRLTLAPSLPRRVRADAEKISQVLLNLLTNAIKYTSSGEVELSASAQTDEERMSLQLSVRDTGAGIAPEDQGRIFQPFYQTELGIRLGEGTGLGLTIGREYVRLLGGSLDVESTLGHGSTFRFSIPVEATESSAEASPFGQNHHVLPAAHDAPDSATDDAMAAGLAALPGELRDALANAAARLDLEESSTAIDRIGGRDAALARQLEPLLERFDFERIVDLCRNGAGPATPA